ncbi:hypothetical protein Golob_001156 [Gossypium lobatum]|uniref:Uncharacterized protein n=1 Tax=Gossypium lobatum TaxID=34289 RepID=A0A7J8NA87_9ROSI|nr:hypothetical protein [Gossypium lobatum]
MVYFISRGRIQEVALPWKSSSA